MAFIQQSLYLYSIWTIDTSNFNTFYISNWIFSPCCAISGIDHSIELRVWTWLSFFIFFCALTLLHAPMVVQSTLSSLLPLEVLWFHSLITSTLVHHNGRSRVCLPPHLHFFSHASMVVHEKRGEAGIRILDLWRRNPMLRPLDHDAPLHLFILYNYKIKVINWMGLVFNYLSAIIVIVWSQYDGANIEQ